MHLNKIVLKSIIISAYTLLLLSACDADNVSTTDNVEISPPDIQANGNPGLLIISPGSNFVVGEALDTAITPSTQTLLVNGWVRVDDNNGLDNSPSVIVNQHVATVTPFAFATDCPSTEPFLCFQFEANLNFNIGDHTISITATDTNNKTSSESISGVVDYCRIGTADSGVPALFQTDPNANVLQNNRCHEIDGCSAYLTENDPLAQSKNRNDPMDTTNHYKLEGTSTAFGYGSVPPVEFFVHGSQSDHTLPCNAHDVCYQTINGMTQQECDDQMLVDMQAVCAQAYPSTCPDYLKNELGACELWDIEKSACKGFARIYYEALKALGGTAFNDRQTEFRN